ncbi:MAG: SpoIIE family protein phosphatase, partial [Bacteroidia bacterium]|nr:SpoIIE family protein phosphatase [Bacteroidia bacterium]
SNQRLTTEVIQKTHFSNRLQAINRDITDSIHYAERIQQSLMPNQGDLLKAFPGSFVLNCPKDIVSGDFYWFHKTSKVAMIAAADCTGHGIPGAFMSVLGITLLNKIVSTGEWERPDVIIELLDLEINNSLGMGRKEHLHDGMDIALCVLDSSKQKVQFVGAMSTIVHVTQQGIAQVYRGNRFGLGGYMRMDIKKFEIQEFTYSPGDMIYFFSDGYIDQFGGVLGKKFYFKNLLSLFKSIYSMEGESQKRRLLSEFMQWKGDCDQTDDVHVMGIRL